MHTKRGGALRYLPLVPLTAHGPAGEVELLALVDSGAEENVLDAEVGEALGLDVEAGREVRLFGYDGREQQGYRLAIDLQVGRQWWRAPVIFAHSVARGGILGQRGFFQFFTVTFRYIERELEIRRNQQA